MDNNRRNFLALAAMAPLALAAAASTRAQTATACYDPAALPFSQKSRRRSLGYMEVSTDTKQHCSACSFFVAAQPGCGTCNLLGGGPVNAGGLCNSFAAKGS